MEEAHYFIKRYNDDAENIGPATQCCKVFESCVAIGSISSNAPSRMTPAKPNMII